jgi:hypothetical protein
MVFVAAYPMVPAGSMTLYIYVLFQPIFVAIFEI